MPYRVIDSKRIKDVVKIWIGADDPQELLSDEVRVFAKEKAEFKFNARSLQINESEVIVKGQNKLPY